MSSPIGDVDTSASHLDLLRESRDRASAAWLQFTTAFRENSRDIFVFFEGHDDVAFFMPELRRWQQGLVDAIYPLRCRGKDALLNVMARVQSRIDRPWRALFFVDKDLDDLVPIERPVNKFLFHTDVYSIENYLVSIDVLRIVWVDFFHLDLADQRLTTYEREYDRAYGKFLRRILPIMAWYLLCRRKSRRPVLANIRLHALIDFSAGRCQRAANRLYTLESRCEAQLDKPAWCELLHTLRELRALNSKTVVRGKFDMWFFTEFVQMMATTLARRSTPGPFARATPHVQINTSNAVEILSNRSVPPQRLTEFLAVVRQAIIAEPP